MEIAKPENRLNYLISIFITTSRDAFLFLSERYGYRLTETRILDEEGAMIRYESARAYLEICYDVLRGGGLTVSLGLRSATAVNVNFSQSYMANTALTLEHCIHRLAVQIAGESQPLLGRV